MNDNPRAHKPKTSTSVHPHSDNMNSGHNVVFKVHRDWGEKGGFDTRFTYQSTLGLDGVP